jgi:Fibronectin type III domain
MMRRFLVLISVLVVALSMIGASALRASADETPPTLSPTQGPAGTHVTASASDWSGCSSMSVSGWGQTTLGTAAVSSSGAFTLSFTVPANVPLGAEQLVFNPTCSHSTILTVATFTVTQGTPPPASCSPSVSLTPSSGAVGSKFVMAGKGWLPGGTVTITLPSTAPGFFESTTPFTFKVAADGTWQLTAIVGTPSSPGAYTFTYAESGCASQTGTFTVTASPTASVPAAPSNLTATAVDQHDIKVTWHDNSSNETGFEINNGVTSRNVGANSTTYTWGGLAAGTYMCFRVRAYNSAGDSSWDPSASPYYVCTTTPKPVVSCPPTPQPTIYWSQVAGPQDTRFTLTGNGWYPNQTVAIHLPSGGAFNVPPTAWRASPAGSWQLKITVGSSTGLGTYRLSFTQSQPGCGALHVNGNFKVTLTVSQFTNSVAAIYQLVSAGNSVCQILSCSKPWNKSLASSAIGIVDTALTVFYETKAIPESVTVGNDLKALEKALKAAHNNKKNPAVQKAAKKLKADTTALENTLLAICPPLEFLFPPAVS